MGLLNNAQNSVNNITNTIKNPFSRDVNNDLRGEDFPDGFQFEELSGDERKVQLNGNLMPLVPFNYGGTQRISKDYYAGQEEPSLHILGSEEKDLEINGRFYDKKYRKPVLATEFDLYGVAKDIADLCEDIRKKGQVLRIWMGEFQRYGILKDADFNLKTIGDIEYTLTFDIIGFNSPTNGKFIDDSRQVPFVLNQELIDIANQLQGEDNIPVTVPASISDLINDATSTVASALNLVTDFVDTVISTTNDIQKATQRALGLIKHAQNKVREYKNFFGGIDPFDPSQSLTGRYENASYYASRGSYSAFLTSFLQRYRKQFLALVDTLPIGRHAVKEGDSLQKIAARYYNDATQWKVIYDHNNLTSADLTEGQILEIPRI